MNLKTQIKEELWLAISNSYEAENYRNAILDSMHYVSDLLREKSGSDNDGAKLVGDALGGKNPKIKINKFQTQSEQNEHKGILQMLMGLYTGIRNPRSHEQMTDTKDTADRIIYFIDYLSQILDSAKATFETRTFVSQRLLDTNFVPSSRYVDLLIDEIPTRRKLEVLILVFRDNELIDAPKINLFTTKLVTKLNKSEQDELLAYISDDLKVEEDESKIISILQMLPPNLWQNIDEIARIRIENMLIQSIAKGTFIGQHYENNRNFGVYAKEYIPYFTLKAEFANTIIEKLSKESELGFVYKFFFDSLPNIMDEFPNTKSRFIARLAHFIGDEDTSQDWKDWLRLKIVELPDDWKVSFSKQLVNVRNEDGSVYDLKSIDDLNRKKIPRFNIDDIPF